MRVKRIQERSETFERRRVTELLRDYTNTATDEEATWSPDGNWIAFTSDRDGNRDIYIMTADGQNVMQVTTNPFDDSRPSWVH
ncbi:MAG: PD40 domain-containing protein [Deltaproteobacteria bacterium]|nr:PD40 domain-containing protein [Deltaproteobacteria bacterium]